MKHLNQKIAVAVFASCLAGAATAEHHEEGEHSMGGSTAQEESAQPGFSDLDKDQDGFISAVEATGAAALMEKWNSVDANGDRKIDSSEFSKFEATNAQPEGQQQQANEPATEGNTMEQGVDNMKQEGQEMLEEGTDAEY